MKILILKPTSLGDVIHALPVLRLLKKQIPESKIHWWIEAGLASLLEGDPDLAGLVHFHRNRWAAPSDWGELWRTVSWMREQKFDWVIDLQSLARSGIFAWLANAGLTVGLNNRLEGAQAFYDIVVDRPSYYTHAVDWYLESLKALGLNSTGSFEWFPARPAQMAAVRSKWPIDRARWICLQPGARWLNKRWPAEYFADVVREIGRRYSDRNFAIFGGGDDRELGALIANADPKRCLDLTGKLTLSEMVEWMRLSELVVSNDTGPMHVAAALRKPVVALMGPTEPSRTGPYGQVNDVLQLQLPCVPCMKSRCTYSKPMECLRALPAAAVVERICRDLEH